MQHHNGNMKPCIRHSLILNNDVHHLRNSRFRRYKLNADFQSIDQALHGQKFSYPFLKEGCQIKNSIFLFLFAVRFTKYPETSYTTSTP